jgi:ubiquinone/menaquinone biosynthesis C-methylase UbiE
MMTEHKEHYWSKFARTYGDDQNYVIGKAIQQLIIQQLSEEHDLGDVIEFGCGTGYFTQTIAKKAKNVLATDLSDEMLEIAKIQLQKFRNITVQRINCEATSFPSERFDTVFMANVIHIVANPIKVLQESHQILRNGGLLLIADFTGYSMSWFETIKLGIRYFRKWGMPPRYARNRLSPDEITSFLENLDFDLEDLYLIGNGTKALYVRARK